MTICSVCPQRTFLRSTVSRPTTRPISSSRQTIPRPKSSRHRQSFQRNPIIPKASTPPVPAESRGTRKTIFDVRTEPPKRLVRPERRHVGVQVNRIRIFQGGSSAAAGKAPVTTAPVKSPAITSRDPPVSVQRPSSRSKSTTKPASLPNPVPASTDLYTRLLESTVENLQLRLLMMRGTLGAEIVGDISLPTGLGHLNADMKQSNGHSRDSRHVTQPPARAHPHANSQLQCKDWYLPGIALSPSDDCNLCDTLHHHTTTNPDPYTQLRQYRSSTKPSHRQSKYQSAPELLATNSTNGDASNPVGGVGDSLIQGNRPVTSGKKLLNSGDTGTFLNMQPTKDSLPPLHYSKTSQYIQHQVASHYHHTQKPTQNPFGPLTPQSGRRGGGGIGVR